MIPELGKYAGAVLSAYGVSFVLLALIIGASVWRARTVRAQLREIEDRLRSQRSQ
ncbi:heme exporter protein CcmD [Marinovum sp.]|uniref:heme exporter protein CcmD n=1 Tax=Marinovum sp. TaxID=2024839 RepID=UPI003A901DF1